MKVVADIKKMRGITDDERNAGLKSLEKRYEKARNDLMPNPEIEEFAKILVQKVRDTASGVKEGGKRWLP